MRKDLDRMTADERLLEACSLLDADGIKKALDDGANVNADDGSQSSLVNPTFHVRQKNPWISRGFS